MTLWPLDHSFITPFSSSCKSFNLFRQVQLFVSQVFVCSEFPYRHGLYFDMTYIGPVLLTMRTYALYNRSIRILSFMLGSGAVLAGIACVRSNIYSLHPGVIYSRFHSWLCLDKKGCIVNQPWDATLAFLRVR